MSDESQLCQYLKKDYEARLNLYNFNEEVCTADQFI